MRQMIIRVSSSREDAELLVKDGEKQLWKSIDLKYLQDQLEKFTYRKEGIDRKPKLLDPRILAMNDRKLIYRENEKRRIVFYGRKPYEINYPAAVYVVDHTQTRITGISCYTYFLWRGLHTNLYRFPMPNMTSSERMCMGTADKTIVDGNVIEAVERIVDAEYTHDHVDNVKERTSTTKWLKMLKEGHVTADLLKNPVCKFENLVETGGMNERT